MRLADIPRHPSERTLRQFAGLCLVFLAAAGAWQAWAHERTTLAAVLIGLGVALGVVGLVRPRAIRWVFVGSMFATFPIGWCISNLVLAVIYFGLFTPLACCFRLARRDELILKQPGGDTYWLPHAPPSSLKSYFRQF